ncbi:MAG: immunoglobulin domain-containing protein [Verrucomicrobiota bacterium]
MHFPKVVLALALLAFCGTARAQLSPTITEQPKTQVITLGSTVTLSAAATGTEPMTFEWLKGSSTEPFATGRTITVSDLAVSSGRYYCRVSNAGGSVTSLAAQVTVIPVSSARPSIALVSHDLIPSRTGDTSSMLAIFFGAQPMTFQWSRNGAPIPGETRNALYTRSVQLSDVGTYTITATNSLGSATSASFFINVPPRGTVPLFVDYQSSRRAKLGLPANIRVEVLSDGPVTYRWEKNGVTLPGVTGTELIIPNVTSADGANYQVYATNAYGTNSSGFLSLRVENPPRLTNLAVRSRVGPGLDELTVGVVVGNPAGGNAPFFLIRGVGPSLTPLGVTGALADPKMTVIRSIGGILSSNDNWGGSSSIADSARSVGAFPFADPNSKDAVVLTSFSRGDYTVLVQSVDDTPGVALAEIYDTTAPSTATTYNPRLVNVSARTKVGVGDEILIAGFTVAGDQPLKVLIRAVGPTLGTAFGVPGVLANPKLTLYSGPTKLGENDDWGNFVDLSAAFTAVGAFTLPGNSRDAAILTTLPPGSYTAQIAGVGDTTGVALVEVYEVP